MVSNPMDMIDSCKKSIYTQEEVVFNNSKEIDQLKEMVVYIKKLKSVLKKSSSKGNSKVDSIINIFANKGILFRGSVLRNLKSIYKGATYKKAYNSLDTIVSKALKRIEMLESEIKDAKRNIQRYEDQIVEYSREIE